MSATVKKRSAQKATIRIRIGNRYLTVEPMLADDVAKTNARIQRKVKPIIIQIKKTRRAAAITASKIILNA